LPSEPRSVDELKEVPDMFRRTAGGRFLIHDSFEEDEETARTVMFTTRRNVQRLSMSPTWFLDVTFKTAPNIFTQVNFGFKQPFTQYTFRSIKKVRIFVRRYLLLWVWFANQLLRSKKNPMRLPYLLFALF